MDYPKFIENGKFNHFGFFEVGDAKFYSKLDAVHHSMKTGEEVEWNYNRELFSKLDWTKDPGYDLRYWYQQRAQQIRDKYDYIVIMFSGGCDSTNVMNSFFDNDIHVDEVFCLHVLDGHGSGNPHEWMNAEFFYLAVPHALEKLKGKPKTRLTVHDNSDWERQMLASEENRSYSWRAYNNIHNLAMCGRYHSPTVGWHQRFERWRRLIDSGKTVAFIWGESKPEILYDEESNRHCYQIEDHYAQMPSPGRQWVNDPTENHENFYSQPDLPELMIKQSHVLLEAINDWPRSKNLFWEYSKDKISTTSPWGWPATVLEVSKCFTHKDGKVYNMLYNEYHQMVYPGWKPGHPQWKQKGRAMHPWHQWLSEEMPTEAKLWYKGYIETFSKLPDSWSRHRGSLEQNIRRLLIRYYIE
jgi:hypothetical protein